MAFLYACHTQTTKFAESADTPIPALQAIDSLMWQRPDSALAVLLDFAASPKADSLDVFDGHYTQLLASELLYKNDYQQSNRTELRQAVAYFDSLVMDGAGIRGVSLPFLTARAHYINGVGFYERDSVVEACGEYLKALETMEEYFQDKDLVGRKAQFMSYTYNRLGDMFSEQFMMESSIVCYNNACYYCKIAPTSPFGVFNSLYRIGKQYNKMGNNDSANFYYSSAKKALPDTNNLQYRDVTTSQAIISYQIGRQAETSVKQLLKMVQLTDNQYEKQTRFFVIGSIYFEERAYDSAMWYLEPVFQKTSDAVMRMQAASYLHVIYDSLGLVEKSNALAKFLANNTKSSGKNKAKISHLNALFQDYLNRKQERQIIEGKIEERKMIMVRTIGIGGFVSVLITLFIVFFIRKKHRESLSEKEVATKHLQFANARLRAENEQLAMQKAEVQHAKLHKAPASAYEALMKETICLDLLQRFGNTEIITTNKPSYYAKLALSTRDKQKFANAVEMHCPNFGPLLKKECPNFTRADFELCRFLLIGLSEPKSAVLLQKDYSTIWKRTKGIKDTLQTVEPMHRLKHILFDLPSME